MVVTESINPVLLAAPLKPPEYIQYLHYVQILGEK